MIRIARLAIATLCAAGSLHAHALLMFSATFNGSGVCAGDNNLLGVCPSPGATVLLETNPVIDVLTTSAGVIGGLFVFGSFQSAVEGSTTDVLSSSWLGIMNTSTAPATVTLAISETGFSGPARAAYATASGTWIGGGGSSAAFAWYDDPANAQGAEDPNDTPGLLIASFSQTAATLPVQSFSFTKGVSVIDDALYSMTMRSVITLAPGATLSFALAESKTQEPVRPVDGENALPLPSTLALTIACAAAALVVRRRRYG